MIGTTITLVFSIVGAIIFIVTDDLWIRDTRRDIAALPEEHALAGASHGGSRAQVHARLTRAQPPRAQAAERPR